MAALRWHGRLLRGPLHTHHNLSARPLATRNALSARLFWWAASDSAASRRSRSSMTAAGLAAATKSKHAASNGCGGLKGVDTTGIPRQPSSISHALRRASPVTHQHAVAVKWGACGGLLLLRSSVVTIDGLSLGGRPLCLDEPGSSGRVCFSPRRVLLARRRRLPCIRGVQRELGLRPSER